MALRLFEPNMANVPQELRSLYAKQADGTFALMLSDLESYVAGLKSALRKQRDDNKELRAKFGISPDGAEALTALGEMPRANAGRTAADVRAGLLPRSGTPQRGRKSLSA